MPDIILTLAWIALGFLLVIMMLAILALAIVGLMAFAEAVMEWKENIENWRSNNA